MTVAAQQIFNKGTVPASPAAGQLSQYFDQTTLNPQVKDENGNVRNLCLMSGNSYRLMKIRYIQQGTTTYTPTSGTTAILARGIGGGASGGGSATGAAGAGAGSGGGGGAFSQVFLEAANIANFGNAWTCQVGAGGVAPSAGNNPGNVGTDTTLTDPGSTLRLTAKGGAAGLGSAAGTLLINDGVAGGLASSGTGDVKYDGDASAPGIVLSALVAIAGSGGAGPFGGGPVGKNSQGNGAAGGNYGAGGTGGASINNGGTAAGGAGANGILEIWEFAG